MQRNPDMPSGKTTIKKCTKCKVKLLYVKLLLLFCFTWTNRVIINRWYHIETLTPFVSLHFKVTFKKLLWRTLFVRHEMFIILWVVIVIFAILATITNQNLDWYKEGSIQQNDYYVTLTRTYQILTFVFIW